MTPQQHPSKYPRRMGKLVRKGGGHPKMGSLGGLWGQGDPPRPRRETSSAVAPSCDLACIMWCVIPVMRACHMWYWRDMCDGCRRLSHTCDTYHPPSLPPPRLLLLGLWLSGIIINWTKRVFPSFLIELSWVELDCPEWIGIVTAQYSGRLGLLFW